MIQALGYPSSALAEIEPRADYFASKAHYQSLARRIAAVLSSGRFVLVTGDPPADPQSLSHALDNVQGPGHAVIDVRCGPEMSSEELAGAAAAPRPRTGGGAVPVPECSATAAPLFLFIDFDQLSDRQIAEVCGGALDGEELRAPGVLLAALDFVARLERPALRFLKERLAAHFSVQEIGEDEVVPFLHNQLLTQRDRRSEARGFRRGILTGLAACGVVAAASGGGLVLLHHNAEQVYEAPAGAGASGSIGEPTSTLRSMQGAATSPVGAQPAAEIETRAASTPAPTPLSAPSLPPTEAESPPPVAPPAREQPPAGPHVSAADIAALLGRGDAFLGTGDITSARLFYERAADAGDGLAALQLGATFDPMIFRGAGLRGVTNDPVQALSWYRRARELGVGEAEQRIKNLQIRAFGEPDTRSR